MPDSFLSAARRKLPADLRGEAERLSAQLPPLLVPAERLAASVALGVHGRRKAGMGESFWQFRRYGSEDPASAIDWRQSAKSQHLFVRQREWEAAEAVWFWRDASASMRYASVSVLERKSERASLLAVALASLLVRGGERIALYGEGRAPSSSRAALARMAHGLSEAPQPNDALPPDAPIGKHAQFVWLSDFLSPLEKIEAAIGRLTAMGVQGHLVHIVDPAEEDYPFEGRTRFETADGSGNETLGRAETVRDEYRARFRAHCEGVASLSRRMAWSCLTHRTDKRPELALIALYADLGGERARKARA